MISTPATNHNKPWTSSSYPKDKRQEPRVTLGVNLEIKHFDYDCYYMRKLRTDNVSLHGARIIYDEKLPLGTIIELTGFKGRFAATAKVRHVQQRYDGNYAIGIEFVNIRGEWVIK